MSGSSAPEQIENKEIHNLMKSIKIHISIPMRILKPIHILDFLKAQGYDLTKLQKIPQRAE
jgi:hypothetical protein